jgi:MerR family regulatory protein
MFSIGDFARLGNVSVRTLRYYEQLGLLMPAAVDPETGYRSYSAYQLSRLHRIVALKTWDCRCRNSPQCSMTSVPRSSAGARVQTCRAPRPPR